MKQMGPLKLDCWRHGESVLLSHVTENWAVGNESVLCETPSVPICGLERLRLIFNLRRETKIKPPARSSWLLLSCFRLDMPLPLSLKHSGKTHGDRWLNTGCVCVSRLLSSSVFGHLLTVAIMLH